MHQYFVFYASACVGREFDLFREVETVHRLDKPDSADGYKVFHVDTRVFKAFRNIHDKPQISFDEFVFRVDVAVVQSFDDSLFFFGRKRRGKSLAPAKIIDSVVLAR